MTSIDPVIQKSVHVTINTKRLRQFARSFDLDKATHWMDSCPVKLSDLDRKERLAFLFVFNAISFCYWGNPKWVVDYQGRHMRGTWSMTAALKRAKDEGIRILDPGFLERIRDDELRHILRSRDEVQIPLLEQRCEILRQVGRVINGNGGFEGILTAANNDAVRLLNIILEHFPSFEDTLTFDGEPVFFYKRAQLFVVDLVHAFDLQDVFSNIGELSGCADYIIPMVLRHLGILKYTDELAAKIDKGIRLPHNSVEEIEIRAHTLKVIQELADMLGVTPMEINDYFWVVGPEMPLDLKHHTTKPRSSAY